MGSSELIDIIDQSQPEHQQLIKNNSKIFIEEDSFQSKFEEPPSLSRIEETNETKTSMSQSLVNIDC